MNIISVSIEYPCHVIYLCHLQHKQQKKVKSALRIQRNTGRNETEDTGATHTFLKVTTQRPTQHLGLWLRMQSMCRRLHHTHPLVPLDKQSTELGFQENSLFIWGGKQFFNPVTNGLKLAALWQLWLCRKCLCHLICWMSLRREGPIKIQGAHTSFNLPLLSFEFLSLSSTRTPCFSAIQHKKHTR